MDELPDMITRLEGLIADTHSDSNRCMDFSGTLSRWSMFWHITLILTGALVAGQGGVATKWGSTRWVTISIIVLGVLSTVGSGFQALFKPGERSPKFAFLGLDYDRLSRDVRDESDAVVRAVTLSAVESEHISRLAAIYSEGAARHFDLRSREISLYVTGPTNLRILRSPLRTARE